MQFQRIYLDSNIFIRAFESNPDDAIGQDLVGILGLIRLGQPPRFVTSQVTLAEVLVQPIRIGDDYKRQLYVRLLSTSTPWLQVRAVSRSVLMQAAELRAISKLKLPDAIHAASAMLSNCSHILTADTDFQELPRTSPEAPKSIQPTKENLDAITAWLRT